MTPSQKKADLDTVAWYKQFWPWFVMLLPLSAVVAGIFTLIISIQNAPEITQPINRFAQPQSQADEQ